MVGDVTLDFSGDFTTMTSEATGGGGGTLSSTGGGGGAWSGGGNFNLRPGRVK